MEHNLQKEKAEKKDKRVTAVRFFFNFSFTIQQLNKDVLISIHASIYLNTQAWPKAKSSLYVCDCFQYCVENTIEGFIGFVQ